MTDITIAVDDYGPLMFYDMRRPGSVIAKGTDGSLYVVPREDGGWTKRASFSQSQEHLIRLSRVQADRVVARTIKEAEQRGLHRGPADRGAACDHASDDAVNSAVAQEA